jgi:hypothetical protein
MPTLEQIAGRDQIDHDARAFPIGMSEPIVEVTARVFRAATGVGTLVSTTMVAIG